MKYEVLVETRDKDFLAVSVDVADAGQLYRRILEEQGALNGQVNHKFDSPTFDLREAFAYVSSHLTRKGLPKPREEKFGNRALLLYPASEKDRITEALRSL